MTDWFKFPVLGVLMSKLIWLPDEQMERRRLFFPRNQGMPHVGDRRVLGGIIYVDRNG